MNEILIVDDNEVNVRLYERVITNIPNTKAVCFTDPGEALDWLKKGAPILLVVDYRMPLTDGLEFMRQFRANRRTSKVPAIMLTAVDHPVLKQQAIAAGVNFFLTKPVNKAQFLAAIKHLLNIL
ncbi:MAG: response regulator [Candidatus Eremiobacteraeota bacterium]|nr:response regulator [Candidatus Eremiobacteraeota bacterium]